MQSKLEKEMVKRVEKFNDKSKEELKLKEEQLKKVNHAALKEEMQVISQRNDEHLAEKERAL